MTTANRYANELRDLVKTNPGVSAGLVRFEQIFDAYMIETPGDFVDKRKALLNAFQATGPDGELAALIVDKLGGMP
jgi:hypothetical protein